MGSPLLRFQLFLCRTLGRTLGELQAVMCTDELLIWLKAYEHEPWGDWRDDLRAGSIQAMLANLNTKRGGFKPSDFMPDFTSQYNQRPKSSDDMKRIAMGVTAMMGGKFKGK